MKRVGVTANKLRSEQKRHHAFTNDKTARRVPDRKDEKERGYPKNNAARCLEYKGHPRKVLGDL